MVSLPVHCSITYPPCVCVCPGVRDHVTRQYSPSSQRRGTTSSVQYIVISITYPPFVQITIHSHQGCIIKTSLFVVRSTTGVSLGAKIVSHLFGAHCQNCTIPWFASASICGRYPIVHGVFTLVRIRCHISTCPNRKLCVRHQSMDNRKQIEVKL